ncbi:MAG: helix-turn-helix transcriptional regulator [Lachnospiraceae bacterium]|nr:helix-turn-helix transcriptional regulator [Lachnospiraceae bacterium]
MDLGSKIKELRIAKGMTQKKLAKLLHVSNSTLSSYENNRYEPPLHLLCKIADLFEVPTDYLLGRTRLHQSFHILNNKINDNYTVGHLMNKIISLDVQNQEEILYYTEYRLHRSNQVKTDKKKGQKPDRS